MLSQESLKNSSSGLSNTLFQDENLVFRMSTKHAGPFRLPREQGKPLTSLVRNTFMNEVQGFFHREAVKDKLAIVDAVHGSKSRIVDKKHSAFRNGNVMFATGVDAIIIKEPGIIAVSRGSDCYPVVIYSPKRHALALVHAGRDGLADNVVSRTFGELRGATGAKAEDCQAIIGPGICHFHFPNSEKAVTPFLQRERSRGFVNREGNQYFLDLKGEIKSQLNKAGITKIIDESICTFERIDCCFSFRRDRPEDKIAQSNLYYAEILPRR